MDAVRIVAEQDHDADYYGAGVLSRHHAVWAGSETVRQRRDGEKIRGFGKLSRAEQKGASQKSGETVLMIDFMKDLWGFMRERKKFWLAPIIIVMVLLGVLIVVAQGSAVAPFIYTLF
jgi:hypothetical protein